MSERNQLGVWGYAAMMESTGPGRRERPGNGATVSPNGVRAEGALGRVGHGNEGSLITEKSTGR